LRPSRRGGPLPAPVVLPVNAAIDMRSSRERAWFGIAVVSITAALYVIFW